MFKKIALSLLAATFLSACTTTDPYTGQPQMSNTAGGAMIGAGLGAVTGLLVGQMPIRGAMRRSSAPALVRSAVA